MLEGMNRARRALILAGAILYVAGPLRAESFLSWSAKAEKAERRNDADAALEAWSNALRLWKPEDGRKKKARALAARAALCDKKGDWDEAAASLAAALQLETKDAVLFFRRGRIYLEHGKAAEAISDFYKATKLKPDYGEAFFDRARAYDLQGDPKFAREDYRTACRLGLRKACVQAGAARAPAGAARDIPAPEAPAAGAAEPLSPDFRACIGRLSKCIANGESYGACVARARLCEEDSRKGCCPQGCVKLFQKLANARSEAQAFREVFRPQSACAPKPKP